MKQYPFALYLLFVVFLSLEGFSQTFFSDSSSVYYVRLKNANEYLGKITNRTNGQIFLKDQIKGDVVLQQMDVRAIELANSSFLILIETNDNNYVFGTITDKNSQQIVIQTEKLGEVIIANYLVKQIRIIRKEEIHNGEYWYPNIHASQMMIGATAIPLKKGVGRYDMFDFLMHQFRYGITDNVSLVAGSLVPFSGFIAARYGRKVRPNFYLGGGVSLNVSFYRQLNDLDVGFLNGVMTYGSESSNITAGLGWTFFRSVLNGRATSGLAFTSSNLPITTLGAQLRITKRTYFVTENYFYTQLANSGTSGRTKQSILSGALRFASRKKSITVGLWLYLAQVDNIVFPHIGYAHYFGKN